MNTFNNLAPFVIIITLIICIIFGKNITKKDLFTIDGIFAFFGCIFGIFMTLLNLMYVSDDLFMLSPLIAITCIIYLRFRSIIFSNNLEFSFPLNNKTLRIINIFYWCFITLALISYIQSPVYHRSPLYFICISTCVSLVGILIVYSNVSTKIGVFNIYVKITLISLILSASAFFISSYPIGSDPWAHIEYINDYLQFNSLTVNGATDRVGEYYLTYPMSHLFATTLSLITNLSARVSFYMIGVTLILSTIFTYLFVKEISNDSNIALFSLLLLSFADCHIQWTFQVIAMSFGLAIYSIIIYLMIKSYSINISARHRPIYISLLVFFVFFIIWTHTISAFITLVTIFCLFIISLVDQKMFFQKTHEKLGSLALCAVMTVTLISHWMNPNYSFFDAILIGISNSISAEVAFLDMGFHSNIIGRYETLLLTFGFLIYTFFGIIGSLFTLSNFNHSVNKIRLFFTVLILYIIRYIFPIFGLRNIIPERWPSFIYVIFVLFITIGFFKIVFSIKSQKRQIASIFIILFVTSFFMVTDNETNLDSPIYGENVIQRLVWTDSEMSLFTRVNELYDNVIFADKQTNIRPFETYLYRDPHKVKTYPINNQGEINWEVMNKNLIIWRKSSLSRPISCSLGDMLLGYDFEEKLYDNFSCIYNTGEAKAFV